MSEWNDEEGRERQASGQQKEDGVEVPFDQLNPETLQLMIQEFVTRDGGDWNESGCTLDEKVRQVLQLLRNKEAKVVFDLTSETANIVASR